MKLELNSTSQTYIIRAYGPGHVVVNQRELTGSLILTPDTIITEWPPQSFEQLSARHFEQVAELGCEIALFGSGGRQRFPDTPLLAALLERGTGIEVMDTAAACRTYNILAAEGRSVAAALLMI